MSTISTALNQGIILGTVTGGGTYASPLTITQAGTIVTPAAAGAAIYGTPGLAGTVVNAGGLVADLGTLGVGIALLGSGSVVVNDTSGGTIFGQRVGVYVASSSTVRNSAGGLIVGGTFGVVASGGADVVVNYGTIAAGYAGGAGVVLRQGGTVVDGGTIAGNGGAGGTAIYFGGAGSSRLVLQPGYTLRGGAVVAEGTANVLELAVPTTGTAGTLSGIGTNISGFATVTVDAWANWVLSGSETIGAGVTLTDLGTLTNAGTILGLGRSTGTFPNLTFHNYGVTVGGGAYLSNTTGGVIAGAYYSVIGLAGARVVNDGSIAGKERAVNLQAAATSEMTAAGLSAAPTVRSALFCREQPRSSTRGRLAAAATASGFSRAAPS